MELLAPKNRLPSMKWLFCPLLLSLALAVSACGGGSSPSPSPSSPAETLQSNDLGPLAVFEDPGTGAFQALGGTGPIHIADACVTMTRSNGEALVLVWRSAEVGWDGTQREITFYSKADPRATEPITIRDGDIITVGGAALDSDVPIERNLPWLATPGPTCEGEQWAVNGLTKPKCDDPLPNGDVAFQGRVLSSDTQSIGEGHSVTRTEVTLERVRAAANAIPYGIEAYEPGVTLTVVFLDQAAPPVGHCIIGTGHVGRYACGSSCDAAGFLADNVIDLGPN